MAHRSCKAAILLTLGLASTAAAQGTDALADGFAHPPASAKPRVWWHWMGGNISKAGIKLDLEWMKRAGIGGAQLVEADLGTPVLVDHPLAWMSPDWKDALHTSAQIADRLGLELTIDTSAGWSATGGPWVKPDAAMQKLVWSTLHLQGGTHYRGRLPQPPAVAGPYQDVRAIGAGALPDYYRDTAVIAFPTPPDPAPAPRRVTVDNIDLPKELLGEGAFGKTFTIPFVASTHDAWIMFDYGQPVVIRSVTLGLPTPTGFGAPPPPHAALEAGDDAATFRTIIELPATTSPVRTASFAPVSARYFRVHLSADTGPGFLGSLTVAPGAILPNFPPAPPGFQLSRVVLRGEGRVNSAEEKAGYAILADYAAHPTLPASVMRPVQPGDVIDISKDMRADGTLEWTPPPGDWTVIRFGSSLTGHRNAPAPPDATGLEVDKLDAADVRAYLDTYLGKYADAAGQGLFGAHGITGILSDSIEAGPQNWTPSLPAEFRRRNGYDLTPYLPALTGIVVGDVQRSDKFLWDFRQTIAELVAEKHYGTIAAAANARGLTYYAEALEDHRPQLGDDMAMRGPADVPMGAMWVFPPGGTPKPTFVADLQGAASVGHIHGRRFIAAESLDAFGMPWAFAPRDLKHIVDLEFALGVNRICTHTSPHQPRVSGRPGIALAPMLGQAFDRNETWAELAGGWTSYLARSSWLLQQGVFAADIAYFYGQDAPLTALYGDAPLAGVPSGHEFDFIDADSLARATHVDESGDIVTTAGMHYKLLILGGTSRRMTIDMLRHVRALAAAGATIAGDRPLESPSLADDPQEFERLAKSIWGQAPTADTQSVGKGHVFTTADAALTYRGITPDWRFTGNAPETALGVLHRHLDGGELWFVSNQSTSAVRGRLSLRQTGYAPELWHADTGAIQPASYSIEGGRTNVALSLASGDAVFVMLRHKTSSGAAQFDEPHTTTLRSFNGPWHVAFPDGEGAPSATTMPRLDSWTASNDQAIRHYAGTAVYSTEIDVQPDWLSTGSKLFLDLGDVRDIAGVTINGHDAGTAWHAPFLVDITAFAKPGANMIDIRVANLWVNRLIGDAQPGAVPQTFTMGPTYTPDAPLRPSGLLGPVRLMAVQAR